MITVGFQYDLVTARYSGGRDGAFQENQNSYFLLNTMISKVLFYVSSAPAAVFIKVVYLLCASRGHSSSSGCFQSFYIVCTHLDVER